MISPHPLTGKGRSYRDLAAEPRCALATVERIPRCESRAPPGHQALIAVLDHSVAAKLAAMAKVQGLTVVEAAAHILSSHYSAIFTVAPNVPFSLGI